MRLKRRSVAAPPADADEAGTVTAPGGDSRGVLATDAGMLALWSPAAFAGVVDRATWERELRGDEDVARHVAAGHLVPLNIGMDGAYGVVVRVGSHAEPAELTERELRYLLVASEPYLLVCDGGAVASGIEHVSGDGAGDRGLVVPVPPGRWSVVAHVLDWELEPDAVDADGHPAPSALPDFAVLLNPERGSATPYRTAVQTFAPEP